METVAVAAALHKPEALRSTGILCEALRARGRTVLLAPGLEATRRELGLTECEVVEPPDLAKADLVIALGGDGTLLAMARHAGPLGTPLLGVDLGSFGFLAAESFDAVIENLDAVLAGEYDVEPRMMVAAEVLREGEVIGEHCGLNDAVIGRADVRRLVRLHTCVNGEEIATYPADGLIISTPTGSTGYTLSAGGPIVSPAVEMLLITPICPHALYSRPLAVESTATIEVTAPSREHAAHGLTLTLDGQEAIDLAPEDRVVLHRASFDARLTRVTPGSFYERLRTKLNWGAER